MPGESHGQRTGRLQSIVSQRVRYNLATEQQPNSRTRALRVSGYGESSSGSFLTRRKSLKNDPWVHDKPLQLCLTLCDTMDCSLPVLCPWDSPGKNFGVGCHALLQGIFPTQGSNPSLSCLLHWQASSLPLVPPGKSFPCITSTLRKILFRHYINEESEVQGGQLICPRSLIK